MEIREGPNTKGVQKMTPLTRGRTLPASMCDVTQHEVIRQNELVAPEKNRKSTSHLDVDVVDLTWKTFWICCGTRASLSQCAQKPRPEDDIVFTVLVCCNCQTQETNERQLRQLDDTGTNQHVHPPDTRSKRIVSKFFPSGTTHVGFWVHLQLVHRKVRHVVWTSLQNKLLLEGLDTDAMELCRGLHRVDVPNSWDTHKFWILESHQTKFWSNFELFLSKVMVISHQVVIGFR